MQLSSIIFISSTLFSSAFANPIYNQYTSTAPPTQPYSPYSPARPIPPTQPTSPRPSFDTVSSYECRDSRPDCLFMGPDNQGRIKSCKDQFQMIHIKRDDLGVNVVEVSFASTPGPYTPDSNYRIRTDSNGQLVYGTEGDIVYFKKSYGAQSIAISPFDVTKELRWCGTGNTVGDGYRKYFSLVDCNSPRGANCGVIHTFRQSGY